MEGTREELLRTAAVHFEEKGYAEVKLAEIAKEAFTTRAPLYYYFENKEGLFRAVVERSLQEAYAGYGAIFTQDAPVFEVIRQDYLYCLKMQGRWKRIWEEAGQLADCRDRVDQFYQWLLDQKTVCFTAARERGELRQDCDVSELITLIYIYYHGVNATLPLASRHHGFSQGMLADSEIMFLQVLQDRFGPQGMQ